MHIRNESGMDWAFGDIAPKAVVLANWVHS